MLNCIKDITIPREKTNLGFALRVREGRCGIFNNELKPLPNQLQSRTRKSSWYWGTVALACLAVISFFLIDDGNYPWVYLRYALGALFILGLPGFALSKALFPADLPIKFKSESMDIVERVAFSVGISLVLVPCVGLLMNYTPWGISLNLIILSLYVLTLIFATIGLMRTWKIEDEIARTR